MGHRAFLRVSWLLKWGIFTGCALKKMNDLNAEFSLGNIALFRRVPWSA